MKKGIVIVSALLLIMGTLTGCGEKTNPSSRMKQDTETAMEKTENAVSSVKNDVEKAAENMTDKGADTSKSTGADTTKSIGVDTSKFIGEEKAKEIALQKAGIAADGVKFDKVKLEHDDGVWQYEVEFKKGNTKYDADIKADDGAVIFWDVDTED